MTNDQLLVYGGTGYTGKLILTALKQSKRLEFANIVFAARNSAKLRAVARQIGIAETQIRVFALTDDVAVDEHLQRAHTVLNLAGPFPETASRLAKAAIRNRANYLDIAGEFEVFRYLDNFGRLARENGVFLMPGTAFTVLATDLVANWALKSYLSHYGDAPLDRLTLRIAIAGTDQFSRGSIKTALNAAREGVPIRRHGKLTNVTVGELERTFEFGERTALCSAVRLADVVTAFHSTGLRNIETYCEVGPIERSAYQMGAEFAIPMQMWPLKRWLHRQVDLLPEGPTEAQRRSMRPAITAQIEDRYRRVHSETWRTVDPYTFTATAVERVLSIVWSEKKVSERGFLTPQAAIATAHGKSAPADLSLDDLRKEMVASKLVFPQEESVQ